MMYERVLRARPPWKAQESNKGSLAKHREHADTFTEVAIARRIRGDHGKARLSHHLRTAIRFVRSDLRRFRRCRVRELSERSREAHSLPSRHQALVQRTHGHGLCSCVSDGTCGAF